ncbi:WXG100 family type VII secretion target [Streptomyces chartreusis]|uniref:WXG100 family type VII secretion target n=1 Tax=Streptomyces chartreusis TaxID=1969 RepID=A0A7I0Y8Y4_STRCX|nr:WXG100 family type VII secretion target [Streptomyces chartreusis]QKZ15965.1 WXG100 family type VII secretion target [Streptomyces chartreusis]
MADYSLQFDGLETAVTEMGRISRQLNDFLQELQTGTMQAITEWESGARDLFDGQRAVWSRAAADMNTQATNAQNSLNQIIAQYADGERAGVNIWNR